MASVLRVCLCVHLCGVNGGPEKGGGQSAVSVVASPLTLSNSIFLFMQVQTQDNYKPN